MLILPIKKEWFDLIKAGRKNTEYREVKPYWDSRFCNLISDFIILKNGYGKNSPQQIIRFKKIEIVKGTEAPYLDPNKEYYAIRIAELYPYCPTFIRKEIVIERKS